VTLNNPGGPPPRAMKPSEVAKDMRVFPSVTVYCRYVSSPLHDEIYLNHKSVRNDVPLIALKLHIWKYSTKPWSL